MQKIKVVIQRKPESYGDFVRRRPVLVNDRMRGFVVQRTDGAFIYYENMTARGEVFPDAAAVREYVAAKVRREANA